MGAVQRTVVVTGTDALACVLPRVGISMYVLPNGRGRTAVLGTTTPHVFPGCLRGASLALLQWARSYGCLWFEGVCTCAALEGHVKVLQCGCVSTAVLGTARHAPVLLLRMDTLALFSGGSVQRMSLGQCHLLFCCRRWPSRCSPVGSVKRLSMGQCHVLQG